MQGTTQRQHAFSLPAPAKLNLFLRVIAQRADGYHDIQTLFQLLDYGDTLTFTPRTDSAIQVHLRDAQPFANTAEIKVADNLVSQAADVLQAACYKHQPERKLAGVDISLKKNIPISSGLGGGSSDAATTLHALNYLWDCNLDENALADLGSMIGADVSLFVRGISAWGEGRGDQLTAVTLPQQWYAVLVPPVVVATVEMFHLPELVRDCPPITLQDYVAGERYNVFQAVVRERYSAVASALDWLAAYGEARLSGSGGSIFASFDTQEEAAEVISQKPDELFGFTAKGMGYSLLSDRLAALSKR